MRIVNLNRNKEIQSSFIHSFFLLHPSVTRRQAEHEERKSWDELCYHCHPNRRAALAPLTHSISRVRAQPPLPWLGGSADRAAAAMQKPPMACIAARQLWQVGIGYSRYCKVSPV
jgi:hypothetical protein